MNNVTLHDVVKIASQNTEMVLISLKYLKHTHAKLVHIINPWTAWSVVVTDIQTEVTTIVLWPTANGQLLYRPVFNHMNVRTRAPNLVSWVEVDYRFDMPLGRQQTDDTWVLISIIFTVRRINYWRNVIKSLSY